MSLSGFTSPIWFVLLVLVALLAAGYLLVQRMRRRRTMRFTNLELLEKVAPKGPGWWRHVPAAVLLVALLLLTVALAGPTAEERVPRNRATVMLVIDVSLSMEATDVTPNRLQAAQTAAKQFADGLPKGINLGLVSFAGSATVLVSPTTDHEQIDDGIDSLKLAEATATGEAIAASLQSIQSFGKIVSGADGPPPARIVLMSDGKETIPQDLNDPRGAYSQAKLAKTDGVPITTISFGTDHGVVNIGGQQVPVPADDGSLHQVANLSGGEFYQAVSAAELQSVYSSLGQQIGYTTQESDASRPWLILGTLLSICAGGASLFIGQRLP
ncbi:MAG TPA: VWA domain-containing protein [Pseudonocardiaceae bacterium]|jgi:Ca-activated chloride channel family protein|nr:VWA domain-containing protein [Pseudonocardiaceae bacterium]